MDLIVESGWRAFLEQEFGTVEQADERVIAEMVIDEPDRRPGGWWTRHTVNVSVVRRPYGISVELLARRLHCRSCSKAAPHDAAGSGGLRHAQRWRECGGV
ncbi:hypothetical protein [Nonomuraea aurantiaca]|uniref:hypothetical protein n=1 Tax=Nonomuraea aurantiaca TaxID=2878562 RepID=UPI001CDA0933|nr:hypothetical protein [Nonomuraea aurantiaca]MCA2222590.1 hypothetical protein [Nonomuraea aurantiaca]